VRVLGGGEDSKVREDVVSFEAVEMALDKEVLRCDEWFLFSSCRSLGCDV